MTTTSAEEHRRFELQARALAEIETDEVPVTIERTLAWVNERRAAAGAPPIARRPPPELELYRRARALGLRRRRG